MFIFMVFLIGYQVMAQEAMITGRVVDAVDGSPLIGVNVKVAGTGTGTITDV